MSAQKANTPAQKGNFKTISAKTVTGKTAAAKTKKPVFLFGKNNFYLMFIGLGLIILGFILMSGARETDPNVFNRAEIYSFRRITLAPILIIGGFVVEVFAIMLKPKGETKQV